MAEYINRWEDASIVWLDKNSYPEAIATMFCPVCKRYSSQVYFYGDPTDGMNYCPCCGAKMREEDNG